MISRAGFGASSLYLCSKFEMFTSSMGFEKASDERNTLLEVQ